LIVVAVVVWLVACCAPLELRRSDTPRIIRMWMCMGVGCTGAALGSRYSVLASVNTVQLYAYSCTAVQYTAVPVGVLQSL